MRSLGVVAIGRNEGERLRRCLNSVLAPGRPVVYVDSGSDDGSVAMAEALGATVVELDLSVPFTAARARNAGWRRLLELHPELQAIQFLDGDCELHPEWLATAAPALARHSTLAVVCGRRRERHPEASPYNYLCDLEWDTPIGLAESCGGDALMRVEALLAVGGFCDEAIAGEEPELCFRLRQQGWEIERLDAEMTAHDAAMTKLRQWWQRNRRAGHAYAANHRRHRAAGFKRAELRSALAWGLFLPLALLLSGLWSPWLLLGFLIYPLQVLRIAHRQKKLPWRGRWLYGLHCVAAKFALLVGILGEARRHRRGEVELIEYK